jgi:DmsE family decaheme c-type cytochrome
MRGRVGPAGRTGQRGRGQPRGSQRLRGSQRPGGWAAARHQSQRRPYRRAIRLSEKGADTCLECHDDVTPGYSGAAIFKSKHAFRSDKRAPFGPGGLQCEACHGPGARHARSKNPESINSLKASSSQAAQERNLPCLGCHQAGARIGWHASVHERSGVACADCHRVHQDRDPVLVKSSEPDVCFTCHLQKQGEFQKPSAHPVRFGQMGCSDCHSPHGSTTVGMLNRPTLNQTCRCHADKRGPAALGACAGERELRALPHRARVT